MSTNKPANRHFGKRYHSAGVTLVELMVSLVIGLFLVGGALKIYSDGRSTQNVDESIAKLQESARYAMSILESDVRLANYWGMTNSYQAIGGSNLPTDGASPLVAGTGANSCVNNFAVNISSAIAGTNNQYGFTGAGSGIAVCNPGYTAAASADTVTVRRASYNPNHNTVLDATGKTLQVCSSPISGNLIAGGVCTGQVDNLIVNTYYIDTGSDESSTTPSLRRKSLTTGPAFQDVEIIPGVEDMQVQMGWDQTGGSNVFSDAAGNLILDATGNPIPPASVTRYVDPDNAVIATAQTQIVAVRIWLLVRAESTENSFVDSRIYSYGDRVGSATSVLTAGKQYQPNDKYRRLLVSKTIFLRNAYGSFAGT